MGKKRRTKQQKIIARLRRQLGQKENLIKKEEKEILIHQTKESSFNKEKPLKKQAFQEEVLFSYSPKLIKRDLIKTLTISFFFLITIFFIKEFFHL